MEDTLNNSNKRSKIHTHGGYEGTLAVELEAPWYLPSSQCYQTCVRSKLELEKRFLTLWCASETVLQDMGAVLLLSVGQCWKSFSNPVWGGNLNTPGLLAFTAFLCKKLCLCEKSASVLFFDMYCLWFHFLLIITHTAFLNFSLLPHLPPRF